MLWRRSSAEPDEVRCMDAEVLPFEALFDLDEGLVGALDLLLALAFLSFFCGL